MRDVASGFGQAELYLGIAALLGTLSCTGVVDGGGNAGTAGPGGPGNTGQTGGPNAVPTNPGRGAMHRLNSTEYNNSVTDVLGTATQPANANWRDGEIEGFDNVASVLGVDDTQYGLYLDAAEALSNELFASPSVESQVRHLRHRRRHDHYVNAALSLANDDTGWISQIDQQWESGDLTIHRLISDLALSVPFRNSGDVK